MNEDQAELQRTTIENQAFELSALRSELGIARQALQDAQREATAAASVADVLDAECKRWRALWRDLRALDGAGNTAETKQRLKSIIARGDAEIRPATS